MGFSFNRQGVTPRQTGAATTVLQGSLVVLPGETAAARLAGEGALEMDPIEILDGGPGTLFGPQVAITYGSGSGWLSLAYSMTPGSALTVTPTVTAAALPAGSYSATLTITDGNASNTGQTVVLTLVVTAALPLLSLFPSTLSLSIADETAVGNVVSTILSDARGGAVGTPSAGSITGTGAAYIASVAFVNLLDGTYRVDVTPTATGGTVGGPRPANIPIAVAGAQNTPLTLVVSITVTAATTEQLIVDRTLDDVRYTLSGSNPTSQVVGVRYASGNAGAAPTVTDVTYSGDFIDWASPTVAGGTLTTAIDKSGILTDGSARANITLTDPVGGTALYEVYLKSEAAVLAPQLIVSPSGISQTVAEGAAPVTATFSVSNANGTYAELGTVTATLSPSRAWASVSLVNGNGIFTFTPAAEAIGTQTTTLSITATLAANSPRTIPISLTVQAVSTSTYPPGPQVAALPNGWVYDQNVGHPVGSCFNDGGYSEAADGNMPAFAGTVYEVPGDISMATALSQLASGAIGDGDVVEIAAGTVLTDVQWPARSGWVEGTSGFVQIRSSGYASLSTYQAEAGPNKFTATHRAKASHLASMFTIRTQTNNRSALLLQLKASGYWFTGMEIRNEGAVMTSAVHTGSHSGTNLSTGQLINVPSHIVMDRCVVTLPAGIPTGRVVAAGSRYTVWRQCSLPSIYTNNTEQQAFNFLNGCERWDIIGNRYGGWGEHIIFGGGTPAIQDWNTLDVMVIWNYAFNDVRANGAQDNDNKNAYEVKTGGRIAFWFNRCEGLNFHGSQKYALLAKASDQAEFVNGVPTQINLFPAHTYDITFWGNELVRSCKKGFVGINDQVADAPSSAAIGTERVEVAWNVHDFDLTVPSLDVFTPSNRQSMTSSRGQGNGVPGAWVYHNTFNTSHTFLAPGALGGVTSGWSNVRYFNNVGTEKTYIQIVAATTGGTVNSAAMDASFGPGNWDMRRNAVLSGTQSWGTTLGGANYQNILTHSGTRTVMFPGAAAFDFTLTPDGSNPGYYLGASYGGGFQTTIGYSKAYLDKMLAGIEENS